MAPFNSRIAMALYARPWLRLAAGGLGATSYGLYDQKNWRTSAVQGAMIGFLGLEIAACCSVAMVVGRVLGK